jgi:ribose transport system substrate-binding protein
MARFLGTPSRVVRAALVAGSFAVVAAACGSDNSSSSSSATTTATTATTAGGAATTNGGGTATSAAGSEAEQLLAALEVRPTKLQTTEPIGKPVPSGKTIDWIVCGVPECTALTKPLTDAAAALGWTVNPIDGGLTPETVQAAWNLAVQNKPDAVVATGFPTTMYSDALAKLKAMNIPVVIGYVTENADPSKGVVAVIAGGGDTFANQGKDEADFVVGRAGNKANTVFLGGSTFPGIDAVQNGFEAEYHRLCQNCPFDSINLPADSIGTTAPNTVVAYIAAHPGVNYLVLGIGSMALGLPQALEAAGAKAKIVGTAPSETTAQMVKEGQIDGIIMLQQADSMWQMVDALARQFAGASVEPSMAPSPAWAVTKDSVDQIIQEGTPYYLIPNYQAQYKALWGK